MAAAESGAETRRASLADYLAPLADSLLDQRLFGSGAWSRCLAVADAVPGDAAFGTLGFELRLGHDPTVDLLVCAIRKVGGARWLRTMTEARASGQPVNPWHAVAALARIWCDGGLAESVDRVWVEFDCAEPPGRGIAELPVPNVFSSTQPAVTDPGAPAADLRAAIAALEVLYARPLAPSLVRLLAEIDETLPLGSRIFQVGGMLGRSPASVRVCMGPGADAARTVLRRLGWTGPLDEVERLLDSLGPLARFVCLDLDAGPAGLGGTAGIEVYVNARDEPADRSQWLPLLDRLEQMNLVTPGKRAALATYPRVQVSSDLLDRLPERYAWATTLLAAHRVGRFVTHLHHVKVTVSRQRPVTAKVYLAFWHEWSRWAATTARHRTAPPSV